MSQRLQRSLERTLLDGVRDQFGIELEDVIAQHPPKPSQGDFAFPVAFDLARKAKMAPRKIAERLAPPIEELDFVSRVEVAGAGYLNVFLDRAAYLTDFLEEPDPEPTGAGKIIVEHTNINPNKAAHIGHLRNAALGDSFVRTLRYTGEEVEVQNYIDDTGVQVADVVVGFTHLESKNLADVEALTGEKGFDYYCWDLYARVSDYFAGDRSRLGERERCLKAIEEGQAPEAPMASAIARAIVHCHLRTMDRIDVRYDLLPWEGDILRLEFWDRAFQLLKENGAIRLATEGKNAGCWVMDLEDDESEESSESVYEEEEEEEEKGDLDRRVQDEKVIVRSNGTVTYVGKDIAYQMWKLGLLDRKFGYQKFHHYPDGVPVWSTTSEKGQAGHPSFGAGDRVFNVIDVRQAYLQRVVQRGVELLASDEARSRSRHFSYEMVALTPQTCRELGFPVSEEEAGRAYLEVSGRKGLGVKADDFIQALQEKTRPQVVERNPDLRDDEQDRAVREIARGALRYYMIKYTKNKVIAFDLAEAVRFEGDAGPYLQYATVRARRILERVGLSPETDLTGSFGPPDSLDRTLESLPSEESDDIWSLAFFASQLPVVAAQTARTEEPAHLARFALQQAQRFNTFYHRYKNIAFEKNPERQAALVFAVRVFHRQQSLALKLMGIPVPRQM